MQAGKETGNNLVFRMREMETNKISNIKPSNAHEHLLGFVEGNKLLGVSPQKFIPFFLKLEVST
ncbi:hypothetical protein J2X07_000207 [Fictibacillus barbaricus]|uniref:Uncharacterized protein n=1 Tax=Fictibacillus barbaricus TaxID=182136 RepID=A0ABU1TVJ7_9BACL|nr:hypothetical protein [Fictibacillus barbaricus]